MSPSSSISDVVVPRRKRLEQDGGVGKERGRSGGEREGASTPEASETFSTSP